MINVDFADVRTVMSEMGMAMMGTGISRGEARAREAAEAAIRSPLLEDVNLQGARGILVNITAGMDLSLGEFAEVGDTVEEFASDNATVVVGTVIDPEMTDELKVTVVATGLGEPASAGRLKPVDMRSRPVSRGSQINYDTPTAFRNEANKVETTPVTRAIEPAAVLAEDSKKDVKSVENSAAKDLDLLDIPAFLRRQAN